MSEFFMTVFAVLLGAGFGWWIVETIVDLLRR